MSQKYPATVAELRKMVPPLTGDHRDYDNRIQQLDRLYLTYDKTPTQRNWVRFCKRALMEN